jgi:glycosyltransferase involved in cell wall biosynthesis
MAGVPQVCVDYPEYRAINDEFNVAYLISDTNVETIAAALNKILADDVIHSYFAANCAKARKYLQWQNEAVKLAQFYNLL